MPRKAMIKQCHACGHDMRAGDRPPREPKRGECHYCGHALRLCPSCGEALKWQDVAHATESRIVRPGNKYGGSGAGEMVEIEPRHISGAILQATMSMEEYQALESVKVKPKVQTKGRLAEMVEKGFEAARAEAKAAIERGKSRAERAEQARAIAIDQEVPNIPPPMEQ